MTLREARASRRQTARLLWLEERALAELAVGERPEQAANPVSACAFQAQARSLSDSAWLPCDEHIQSQVARDYALAKLLSAVRPRRVPGGVPLQVCIDRSVKHTTVRQAPVTLEAAHQPASRVTQACVSALFSTSASLVDCMELNQLVRRGVSGLFFASK